MPAGVEVVIEDGFATVTPEPAQRGRVLTALLAAVDDPTQIRTDTSGRRRSYVVLEQDAREAGLLDEPAEEDSGPVDPFPAKVEEAPIPEVASAEEPKIEEAPKAPAKKAAARKAPAKKAEGTPVGEALQ